MKKCNECKHFNVHENLCKNIKISIAGGYILCDAPCSVKHCHFESMTSSQKHYRKNLVREVS